MCDASRTAFAPPPYTHPLTHMKSSTKKDCMDHCRATNILNEDRFSRIAHGLQQNTGPVTLASNHALAEWQTMYDQAKQRQSCFGALKTKSCPQITCFCLLNCAHHCLSIVFQFGPCVHTSLRHRELHPPRVRLFGDGEPAGTSTLRWKAYVRKERIADPDVTFKELGERWAAMGQEEKASHEEVCRKAEKYEYQYTAMTKEDTPHGIGNSLYPVAEDELEDVVLGFWLSPPKHKRHVYRCVACGIPTSVCIVRRFMSMCCNYVFTACCAWQLRCP